MSTCTFFGHRDCPEAIKPKLKAVLIDLIENRSVNLFYVGRQGAFDSVVRSVLRELSQKYPHIDYAVVLERLPGKQDAADDPFRTILPEGMEQIHPRFAIDRRNAWMVRQSTFVVAYVTHAWGGAAKFMQMAIRQKKTVINLAEIDRNKTAV